MSAAVCERNGSAWLDSRALLLGIGCCSGRQEEGEGGGREGGKAGAGSSASQRPGSSPDPKTVGSTRCGGGR